jgi:hypothetical protein
MLRFCVSYSIAANQRLLAIALVCDSENHPLAKAANQGPKQTSQVLAQ